MARQYSLPIQVLATLRVAALVLALTGIFLWFVLGRVQEQIENTGRENFSIFAHSAFNELDSLTQANLRYLDMLSRLLPTLPDLYSEQTTSALAQTFLQQPGPNALTVVRKDDGMLYFLKRDAEAPAGTAYTMGHLQVQADGKRLIYASYHTADHRVIGQRRIPIMLYPSRSEWYQGAIHSNAPYLSLPHPVPGRDSLAITLSVKSQDDRVISLTTPLELIDRLLERISVSANGAALLVDDQHRLIAFRMQGPHWHKLDAHATRLDSLTQLGDPVLADAANATDRLKEDDTSLVSLAGQPFLLAWHRMAKVRGTQYRMLLLSPLGDMSQAATGARRDVWLVTLVALAILLPMTWWGTGRMAQVLQRLVQNSQRIGRLDFEPQEFPLPSAVREIRELGLAHESMRNALCARTQALERVSRNLERLIGIGVILVDKKDQQDLLDAVLGAAREIAGAEAAILLLRDENDFLQLVATAGLIFPKAGPGLDLKLPRLQRESLAVSTVLGGTTIVVDNMDDDTRELLTNWRLRVAESGLRVQTVVSLPLRTDDRVVGVMQVLNAINPDTGQTTSFSASQISYLESLAAQATVALDNQKLIASQRRLLETLVRTLGEAVDAKSAYTGRHCARVPELAMMLAQEAHSADSGPLADFAFHSEEEWREFHTGAWLHDCGKITSPEHVMDKATKLETVYNRVHEIRTRFEVLLRDARIEILQAQLDGDMNVETAGAAYAQRALELREQYAIIARCNVGSEKMAADDIARIRAIGQLSWMRHFDNRIGLSHEELARHHEDADGSLPVSEPLLADKPWQVIERAENEKRELTEGFRMQVPEHLYNHGELYNLCIERGTLTLEERFKINEHIIHTIRMLEGAHFPSHLRRVPEYAGTHHETMDGSGYPRGLTAAELSIPARIMAIADIFEALTAADRPYKAAKTLSESIKILHRMKVKGLIDPNLFDLFLRKGVHLRYAQRFLAPEQIDMPDITPYLN